MGNKLIFRRVNRELVCRVYEVSLYESGWIRREALHVFPSDDGDRDVVCVCLDIDAGVYRNKSLATDIRITRVKGYYYSVSVPNESGELESLVILPTDIFEFVFDSDEMVVELEEDFRFDSYNHTYPMWSSVRERWQDFVARFPTEKALCDSVRDGLLSHRSLEFLWALHNYALEREWLHFLAALQKNFPVWFSPEAIQRRKRGE